MPSHTPTTLPLRVIPLGGLDQFGMNCCLLEIEGRLVMVDCGITFPDVSSLGIDSILPDWQWLLHEKQLNRLDAIIITHGHEDHLGALPYFLEEADIPVYTGRMTAEMLRFKLQEHSIEGSVEIIEVAPQDIIDFDSFSVEFIHVNHSIPNAMALCFETPLGQVLFTGDWKLDQTPPYEPITDLHRFAQIGQKGVFALLGDSTNAITTSRNSVSERDVYDGLFKIIEHAEGRVIVALFSSNVHRLISLIRIAKTTNRRLALLGFSLSRNFQIAKNCGFLPDFDPDLLLPEHEIKHQDPASLIIAMTGTQAEPRASLPRYAYGTHRAIKARPDDTVILSARIIPGNEADIYKLLNQLAKQDIRVVTPKDAVVHASGHASKEDLKLLLNLTQPTYHIPMHGDYRIRKAHGEMGRLVGSTPILLNDGDCLRLEPHRYTLENPVPHGRVFVDGESRNELDTVQIRDRKKLSTSGIIVALLVVSEASGSITTGPDLLQRGFLPDDTASQSLLEEAAEHATSELLNLPEQARLDHATLGETLRTSVRRFFRAQIKQKPVVIPIVHMM